MLVLALDTSTSAVTVAVAELPPDGHCRPLASRTTVADNQHGELLAPLVRDVLAAVSADPRDLSAIGVGLGPGPFTGLRVGVMTAVAMGDALGIATYGVCSLDVVAWAHRHRGVDLAVVTDARRKQVYWARYSETGTRLEGPDIGFPVELAGQWRDRVSHVVGAGTQRYPQAFAGLGVIADHGYPDAAMIPSLIGPRILRGEPADELTPLYLRRPDAVPPGRPKQVTPA